ncbi:MAG: NusA-like transcription termination signal-binding factor [Candidatus Aenigmarchaeota archaeon]|nr:NusA-like transcription termination signal-binding factor [Candidatus Aenigmarchaeota archaeon]
MKVILNAQAIQSISVFQNMTGSSVIDYLSEGDEIFFVVAQGQYGLTVGKGGAKIRNAEKLFKKSIRIIEYSPDIKEFIKNIIPETQEIDVREDHIEVHVKQQDRAKVIGKGGRKIKIINQFLGRLFGSKTLKVK